MDESVYDAVFAPLTVGDEVPEDLSFDVFKDGDFSSMSFGDLRGKWTVLMFYPKDFTFVCPTELGEMAHLYEAFKKEGAEIV